MLIRQSSLQGKIIEKYAGDDKTLLLFAFCRSRILLSDSMRNLGFDSETLLNVMKSFILDQLQDKVIDSRISVAICIGDCEVGDAYLSSTS